MLQPRFAMHDPYVYPLNPTPFLVFFHLPIRQRIFGAFAQAGRAPSLRKLCAPEAATEELDAVLAVDFAYREIALARKTKLLAFGIDTR
jgi:hypothetical protein